MGYETKDVRPEMTIQLQECVQRWGREAPWSGNSCLLGTHTRFPLEQFLYLSILQEQGACSTFLQQSPSSLLAWWLSCLQERQTARLRSNCAQGSGLLRPGSSLFQVPEKPSPWSFPAPSQHLTLDAHTHVSSFSCYQNSGQAVEVAGSGQEGRSLNPGSASYKLCQSHFTSLYLSFPLICLMEWSKGLTGHWQPCLTASTRCGKNRTHHASEPNKSLLNGHIFPEQN